MKSSNPLEKVIEQATVKYAQSKGALVYKFTSPNRRSVPDRIFIPKNKPAFFIEFKRLGQKPTAAQEIEISKIRSQGTYVGVVDSIEAGRRVIEERMGV